MIKEIQIIIGGAAGEGSKKAGLIIAKLFNLYGFHVFIHEDYCSVIKGGHNFSQISVSSRKKSAINEKIDFLLALNYDTIEKHKEKLKEDGILIYDSEIEGDIDLEEDRAIKIPLSDIVNEAEGIPLMKNTALVAAFSKITGMKLEKIEETLRREFKKETEKNLEVARLAYQKSEKKREIEEEKDEFLPLFCGNHAVALGAIDAGLENYFAYPMTPSTGVLQFLSNVKGIRTFQPESEIAVINAGIGSAYTGRRTMIGTSGGGFALMTEGVSLSAISETPLLIVMSQRMGPATGVPTYQAQGDLLFTLFSGHGDMMRFVVAPGDATDCYYLAGEALNIAWRYQMPAILLLDKEISENTYELETKERVKKEDIIKAEGDAENYNRYEGEDISPLLFPGEGGVVKATGYEHDKKGVATEDAEKVKEMVEKRIRKHEKLKEELREKETIKVENRDAKTAVIFWGSTKGAMLEATKDMDLRLIQIIVVQPFPEEKIKEALKGVEKIICVETNATGQMAQALSMHGVKSDEKILKYNGRPFFVEELKRELEKIV